MEARLDIAWGRPCDEARALASLALDASLTDEVSRRFLRRHLSECAACARFVSEMDSATALLRSAPLDPFRCGPVSGSRLGPVAHRAHWAVSAAAVVAIAIGVASLPQASNPPMPLRPVVAAVHVPAGAPVKLPIGQRSAESDFADGLNALQA